MRTNRQTVEITPIRTNEITPIRTNKGFSHWNHSDYIPLDQVKLLVAQTLNMKGLSQDTLNMLQETLDCFLILR